MISLAPLKDKNLIYQYFNKANIEYNENCGCVTATIKNEVLGFCLYELTKDKITVFYIEPQKDIPLADGILRSTLHIAAEKSIMNAYYTDTLSYDLLKITDFIENEEQKKLNINKLFKSCGNCG